MTAIVNGKLPALKPYTKIYDGEDASIKAYLDKHFPRVFAPKSHTQASKEIHSTSSWYKTTKEREITRQLLEEGRYEIEGVESEGLPENLGEVVDFITHLTHLPEAAGVKTATVAGQTVPSEATRGSAGEKGESELPGIEADIGKYILEAVLLLAGAVLFVYGVMVAVKPRESAFSVPPVPIAIF